MKTPDDFWFNHIREMFISETSQINEYSDFAISSFDKKWVGGGIKNATTELERDSAAAAKFQEAVDKGIKFNETFANRLRDDEKLSRIFGYMQGFVESICSEEHSDETQEWTCKNIFANLGCGPGSSQGSTGGSWIEKFAASDLTVYSNNVSLYKYFLYNTRRTMTGLVETERSSKFGVKVVEGSKQQFVLKNSEISRMIATEASLPMAFQLSVHHILTRRLKTIGLDLETQQRRNRILAKRGSIDGDVSTIDLSGASDSVFLALVVMLFKNCRAFLWYLLNFRSDSIILTTGEVQRLPMLSTMGNGYTFAVETLIFLAIVVGVARETGTKLCWRGPEVNCGVYGDDIIVPTSIYREVTDALQSFGFTLNLGKCFTSPSQFRESCGGDYLNGIFVRGVYLSDLQDDPSIYSALNRLIMWSSRSGIPIPGTLRMLRERLTSELLLVPLSADVSSGLKIPWSCIPASWTSIPISKTLVRLMGLSPKWSGCVIYTAYQARAKRFKVLYKPRTLESDICQDDTISSRFAHTPSGVCQGYLGGYVRNGQVSVRNLGNAGSFRKTLCASLDWDYYSDDFALSLERGGTIDRIKKAVSALVG